MNRRDFLGQSLVAGAMAGVLPTPKVAAQTKPVVPFSLGIVTYNIAANWDLTTVLSILKKTGLKFVEFRTTHKHGVEPSLNKEARAEVRKRCADTGVTIWGLGTVCEFHSPDAKVVEGHVESCKRFLELGQDLGAKGVKVRPNGLPKEVAEEKTLEQIGKALFQCGEAAKGVGQEVWVEVHGQGTSQPVRMKKMMENANHPSVGICWNSNAEDVKNGSVAESFSLLKPWLKSCHINSLHSSYPYRQLFKLLKEAGYSRVTLCEIPEKIEAADGEVFLRYYKKLWEELCSEK